MQGSSFIAAELARLAWLDAHEEGLLGMLGVCFTIRNRVRAGWFSGNWVEVLSNHRTYSAKTEPYPDTVPDPRVYAFQCLLQDIDAIFSGQRVDDVTIPANPSFAIQAYKPALYYGRLDQITNPWFLENIARQPEIHPRVAQVGMMYFFA
jgi:hypothetical protein